MKSFKKWICKLFNYLLFSNLNDNICLIACAGMSRHYMMLISSYTIQENLNDFVSLTNCEQNLEGVAFTLYLSLMLQLCFASAYLLLPWLIGMPIYWIFTISYLVTKIYSPDKYDSTFPWKIWMTIITFLICVYFYIVVIYYANELYEKHRKSNKEKYNHLQDEESFGDDIAMHQNFVSPKLFQLNEKSKLPPKIISTVN